MVKSKETVINSWTVLKVILGHSLDFTHSAILISPPYDCDKLVSLCWSLRSLAVLEMLTSPVRTDTIPVKNVNTYNQCHHSSAPSLQ